MAKKKMGDELNLEYVINSMEEEFATLVSLAENGDIVMDYHDILNQIGIYRKALQKAVLCSLQRDLETLKKRYESIEKEEKDNGEENA